MIHVALLDDFIQAVVVVAITSLSMEYGQIMEELEIVKHN